jgi:hypothetical protein
VASWGCNCHDGPGGGHAETGPPYRTSRHVQWSVHLAARRPRQAALVVGVILVGAIAAAVGFGSFLLGLLAAGLLVASVADYLLPVHDTLSEAGVSARAFWRRRHLSWSQVARVMRDELGVKLSPLARPSRLEAYRGIYLWFAGNEPEVMAAITHYTTAEAAGGDDRPPSQLSARAP